MTSVKLGVHLPVAGPGASPEVIAQVAEEAERIGLDSVWSWERLMRPTVPIAMGGPDGPVGPRRMSRIRAHTWRDAHAGARNVSRGQ